MTEGGDRDDAQQQHTSLRAGFAAKQSVITDRFGAEVLDALSRTDAHSFG
jgi:hypothetical protein